MQVSADSSVASRLVRDASLKPANESVVAGATQPQNYNHRARRQSATLESGNDGLSLSASAPPPACHRIDDVDMADVGFDCHQDVLTVMASDPAGLMLARSADSVDYVVMHHIASLIFIGECRLSMLGLPVFDLERGGSLLALGHSRLRHFNKALACGAPGTSRLPQSNVIKLAIT